MSKTHPHFFNEFNIEVSSIHTVNVREFGNPDGKAVVILHGGPGGGCRDSYADFFDNSKWRIIMFDQRGCGKSKPFAELRENTTWELINDIEKIRNHLKIKKWSVFGGSWGSTLALSYACSYPKLVSSLILRGIFLCRQKELNWFYELGGGASCIYPDAHEQFYSLVKDKPGNNVFEKYYSQLTNEDESIRKSAARAWSIWEAKTSLLIPNEKLIADFEEDEFAEAFARIECHYFINDAFFDDDTQILSRIDTIKSITTDIVQGRYDIVCPPISAWELHKALPQSNLFLMQDSGHSASEKSIKQKLTEICSKHLEFQL